MLKRIFKFLFLTLISFLIVNLNSNYQLTLSATNHNLEKIISNESKVKKIAEGFKFTEGPVWNSQGYLLFSDIPANTIYTWQPGKQPEIFRQPSGNANGNTFDKMSQLFGVESIPSYSTIRRVLLRVDYIDYADRLSQF